MASFMFGVRGGLVASVRSSLPLKGMTPMKKKKPVVTKKVNRKEERRNQFIQILAQRQTILTSTKPVKERWDPELKKIKKKNPWKIPWDEKYRRREVFEDYTVFCKKENALRHRQLRNMLDARKTALNELRLVSEDLFRAAVAVDLGSMPMKMKALPHTPPIPGYKPPEFVVIKKT